MSFGHDGTKPKLTRVACSCTLWLVIPVWRYIAWLASILLSRKRD